MSKSNIKHLFYHLSLFPQFTYVQLAQSVGYCVFVLFEITYRTAYAYTLGSDNGKYNSYHVNAKQPQTREVKQLPTAHSYQEGQERVVPIQPQEGSPF